MSEHTKGRFQSFLDGFASAWDFTRPFSEKAKIRRQNVPFDIQWTQELGLDVPCWEEVANYLNNAIETHNKEITNDGTQR